MNEPRRRRRTRRCFYLHGDLVADGRAWCQFCSSFQLPAHFSMHGDTMNIAKTGLGFAAALQLAEHGCVLQGARVNLFDDLLSSKRL